SVPSVASTQRLSCGPFPLSPLRRRAHPLHQECGVVTHHFTVDVEEYFHVSAFKSRVRRVDWDRYESRVTESVFRLLSLLARHEARGTFFVLGWVAERHPDLVRQIAGAGHEVASHSWDHARVTQQSAPAFRDSVRRTKAVLEDLSGAPVSGFRAPDFSIVHGGEWALDILIEEGYRRDPHWLERPAGRLAEV